MTAADELIRALASRLVGPRRARNRLLAELEEHLHDAVQAELSAGLRPAEAEAAALARLGAPEAIAARWNDDRLERRGAGRRHATVLVAAVALGAGLGLTQYAAGKGPPAPHCRSTSGSRACEQPPAARLPH